jgi:nicotinate-nucleotide pyrophosphorylase (carboxylating)
VVAQAPGVVSGIAIARELARQRDVSARARVRDGARVHPGQEVVSLSGDLRRILGVERTLLNYLMHLSGVATATARAVAAARPLRVYATRKTLPGLRDAEKSAVIHGGGYPHRRDLSSGVLVKGTHLAYLPIAEAVRRARRGSHSAPVQVEVSGVREAIDAARAGAGSLLIDNRRPAEARHIVLALSRAGLRGRVWVELSGGITPENVARYRTTGADAVSLGSITHSAPTVPFHLEVHPRKVTRRRPPL